MEYDCILTLIQKILEFPAPAEELAAQNLNYMIFLNVCLNLGIELSAEAQDFLALNDGANRVALENVQK